MEMVERKLFMSELEQDAQLGKTMRDLANVRDELRRRRVQASQIADTLDELSKLLRDNPAGIFFVTDSIPGSQYGSHKTAFETESLDGAVIQSIAGMIRKLEEREKELERRLAELGYPHV